MTNLYDDNWGEIAALFFSFKNGAYKQSSQRDESWKGLLRVEEKANVCGIAMLCSGTKMYSS